jgi:endonuclease III
MSCWGMRLDQGGRGGRHARDAALASSWIHQQKTAEKIEQDLIPIVPKKDWVIFPHLMIYHGRKICKARNPLCEECTIEKFCPSSF